MFTTGGTNVTIRGNQFWNCHTYAIATGPRWYSAYENWTIENNWFGRTCCFGTNPRSSAIHTGNAPNLLIRFNSFAPGQTVVNESGGGAVNVRIVGNILGSRVTGCVTGATYVQNLQVGGGCGPTDQGISSAPYVSPSNIGDGNFHLLPGSIADGFVTSTSADATLGTDKDGDRRSAPRDAGSDER